ncbi:MAG: dipicolinate synthase subunit B [Clostridia bacterium]|nr:dipicolinate synthase subunit B [Clostridia bacterium]
MFECFDGLRVGLAVTGSFCTHRNIAAVADNLVKRGAIVYPILSYSASETSTRFMTREELHDTLVRITGHEPICTIKEAEPIGPKKLLDVVVVVPCTGNTISKLANAITDTPVLMACKSHLRNNRPVVIAVSTNDGLSGNARNIGTLLAMKNYYFVPFRQDDSVKKPFSLVADFSLVNETVAYALDGIQIQPILL